MANQTKDTPNEAVMTTAAATALNPTAPKAALGPKMPPFVFEVIPAGFVVDADPALELESPDDGLLVVDPVVLVLGELVPGEEVPELELVAPLSE